MSRSVRHALAFAVAAASLACGGPERTDPIAVRDLDGAAVDALAFEAPLAVFVFVRSDCPISNRYAPELARLHEAFTPRGVAFRLVYVDPREAAPAIQAHRAEYGLAMVPLRDPEHALVTASGVRVTPEVAVYRRAGERVYRGRIDDRFVAFGEMRPEPTRHDLADALRALLAGGAPREAETEAIGCFIADLG